MSKSDEEKQCQDLCYVCQESMNYTDSHTLFELPGCGHTFHVDCHSRIFPTDACPICEKPISLCERPGLSTRATGKQRLSLTSDIDCDTSNAHSNYDSDIEVSEEPPEHLRKKIRVCDTCVLDGDITITQVIGDESRDLPHTRQNCVKHPHGTKGFCDKCYCIICDKPASLCTEWEYHHSVDSSFMDEKQSLLQKLKPLAPIIYHSRRLNFEKEHLESIQRFYFDKDIMIQFVRLNGDLLKYASVTLKADKDIVLAAIQYTSELIRFAHDAWDINKEIVWKLVEKSSFALRSLIDEALLDEDLSLHIVKSNKRFSWQFIPEAIKYNRDFFLEVMKVDGSMLDLGNETLKYDKEVVATAIQNHRRAFYHADESLRNDKSFILELMEKGQITIDMLDEYWKSDEEVVLIAITISLYGCHFRHAGVTARANKNIILEAVNKCGDNIEFCSNDDLLMDPHILQVAANASYNRLTKKKLRKILWNRMVARTETEFQTKMDTLNWEQRPGKKVHISVKQQNT